MMGNLFGKYLHILQTSDVIIMYTTSSNTTLSTHSKDITKRKNNLIMIHSSEVVHKICIKIVDT